VTKTTHSSGRFIAVGLVGLLVAGVSAGRSLDRFELPARDRLLRMQEARPASRVALIAIDDASLDAIGRWPWTRSNVATLADRAMSAGATAVAVDLLFLETAPGDEDLARSLAAARGVLPVVFEPGRVRLPPEPLASAAELAHGLLEVDDDGVLRRLASTKQAGETSFPAIAEAMALRLSTGRSRAAIPVGKTLIPGFAIRPDAVPVVSAKDLLEASVGPFDGRVVFIGVTAAGFGDRVITPVTRRGYLDPGVAVHAAVSEAIASGDLLRIAPPWLDGLIAAMLWLAVLATGRLGGLRRALLQTGLGLLPGISGTGLLLASRVSIPVVTFTLVVITAILVLDGTTLLRVQRVTGTVPGVAVAAGDSPLERVAALERFARDLSNARVEDLESRRVVAHELKSPLTSIRGFAQLLAQYDLSPGETRRIASMVAEESSRLNEMVVGLLDLERLALRDKVEGDLSLIDLSSILRRRVELARGTGSHTVDFEAETKLLVVGDAPLLERVFENLVGNAMKFSPPGSTINVRGRTAGAEVVVEVQDAGPGVPEHERNLIFSRFGRGTSSKERPGLGLGLAFVAEIVEFHGGRANVTDGAAGGACFRVYVPMARPEDAEEV